jgi:hypothetical protein
MNLNFVEIKFRELKTSLNDWIKKTYNKSETMLSSADPYGHILQAVEKIYHASMLYQKNILSQFELNNPNNQNSKMIHLWARVAGYNPGRAISATGTISLQLKPGVNILEDVPGGEMVIYNNTKIVNKTNGNQYFVDLGAKERINFLLDTNKKYYLPIVQGRIETEVRTGTGETMQSFSVSVPSQFSIENYRISITVNGEYYAIRDQLYDMLPDEPACIIRTGINGGIDVYFGNSSYGAIPPIGAEIRINYVVTNGIDGNIPHKLANDWSFVGDVFGTYGDSIEVDELFFVFIEDEISMGSNPENPQFTRAVLPYASRNFVLAKPEQYVFHLKRLDLFTQIDAFTDYKTNLNGELVEDSVVYLFLVPNITNYLGNGSSYFDLAMDAFYLEDSEKVKIERYLKMQGTVSTGTSLKILDPKIIRYTINIYLRVFDDAIEDNVRNEILNRLSVHFTNLTRRGRIAKSDMVRIIEDIDGVDSLAVDFISEANERYHLAYEQYKKSVMQANPLVNPDEIKMDGYEPDKVIGLDVKLGDIVYAKDQLPIIRGGWSTRDGVYFNETPSSKGISSVNVVIDGVSKRGFTF